MNISQVRKVNTERLIGYAKDSHGHVKDLLRLRRDFGCDFDGTAYYIDVSQAAVAFFTATGEVIGPWDEAFFFGGPGEVGLLPTIAYTGEAKTLLLTIHPPQGEWPYAFVAESRGYLEGIACLVDRMQTLAQGQLSVVIRYSPEMNAAAQAGEVHGVGAAEFVRSFRMVRELFAQRAPGALFSFSPAIRSDLDTTNLSPFWPGADCADIVSCTWYVGSKSEFDKSVNQLLAFFRNRQGHMRYAIDEIGISEQAKPQADDLAIRMLSSLVSLNDVGIRFEYLAMILDWAPRPRTTEFLAHIREFGLNGRSDAGGPFQKQFHRESAEGREP